MRAPGIPWQQNQGRPPLATPLAPTCVVLHRTIGHWAGDFGVLIANRVPSVHFLVGQAAGQWVQMVDSNVIANHAAGANTKSVGIEFSGQNGEPLTSWQIDAGGVLLRWLSGAHSVPLTYYDGPRVYVDQADFHGVLNHRNVAYPAQTSLQHDDFIPEAEFAQMTEGDMPLNDADKQWILGALRSEGISGANDAAHSTIDDAVNNVLGPKLDAILAKLDEVKGTTLQGNVSGHLDIT